MSHRQRRRGFSSRALTRAPVARPAELAFLQKKKEEEKALKALKETVRSALAAGCWLWQRACGPAHAAGAGAGAPRGADCNLLLPQAKKGPLGGAGLKKSGGK
jgi:hypothetical protein